MSWRRGRRDLSFWGYRVTAELFLETKSLSNLQRSEPPCVRIRQAHPCSHTHASPLPQGAAAIRWCKAMPQLQPSQKQREKNWERKGPILLQGSCNSSFIFRVFFRCWQFKEKTCFSTINPENNCFKIKWVTLILSHGRLQGKQRNWVKRLTITVLLREDEESECGPIYPTFIRSEKQFIFRRDDIVHHAVSWCDNQLQWGESHRYISRVLAVVCCDWLIC